MPHVTVAQKLPSVRATKFDIKGDSSSANYNNNVMYCIVTNEHDITMQHG